MGNKIDIDKTTAYQKAVITDRSVPSMSTISFDSHHKISYPIYNSSAILIRKQRSIIPPSIHIESGKSTSIELTQLLVYGYARTMQNNLNDYIIPTSIIELCLDFYYVSKIVICLSEGNDIRGANINGLFMSDIDNNTNWKLTVYDINNNNLISTDNEYKWVIDSSGICYQQSIKQYLSPNILSTIETLYEHKVYNHHNIQNIVNQYKYNAIFKCGGIKTDGLNSNYAHAILLADGETKAWNWELPCLPDYIHGNELVFHSKYGICCIGGQDDDGSIIKNIYNLKLNNVHKDTQWQWNKLSNVPIGVSKCSSCLIDNVGEDYLFIVGGQTSITGQEERTQIYNLQTQKWHFGQSSITSRFEAGIYYDRYRQRVYFCGGKDRNDTDQLTKYNEYYEIEKDMWLNTNLPLIKLGLKPLIWTENDMLYTASFLNYGFSMQYIDLRVKNKQWSVQQDIKSDHKHLSHAPYPQAICRLLI